VPSNVPIVSDPRGIAAIRKQYIGQGALLGHFGTFNPVVTSMLIAIVPPLLRRSNGASLLLIGGGSHAFRERLIREFPDLDGRVHAAGHVDTASLSLHLSACDVLIQPYPDGVTTRRSTVMAALAHGLSTVSTTGELTEPFWLQSGALAVAPAEESDAFVERALELLESPEKRAALGESGREFYQERFDIRHIVEAIRASGELPAKLEQ
jgi:glycosyltransferase involved in cell wall biosynthesis